MLINVIAREFMADRMRALEERDRGGDPRATADGKPDRAEVSAHPRTRRSWLSVRRFPRPMRRPRARLT